MKKNLYFLDEDEKRRILKIHESRTKQQYLVNEIDFNKITKIVNCFKGFKPMGNDIFFDNSEFFYYPNNKYTDKTHIEKFKSDRQSDSSVQLNQYMVGEYTCSQEDTAFGSKEYVLRRNPYKEGGFMNIVNRGVWSKYPCIVKNYKKTNFKDDDNNPIYEGDGKNWYLDGTVVDTMSRIMYKYECNGDYPKLITTADSNSTTTTDSNSTTTDQSNTNNQSAPNTGANVGGYQKYSFGSIVPNTITSKTLTDIRTKIGSSEQSGALTQADINALYKKISGQ